MLKLILLQTGICHVILSWLHCFPSFISVYCYHTFITIHVYSVNKYILKSLIVHVL